ncbi:thioredoxin [SAR86 cluster bacterium]|jgi:thioredoxin 1|nr:thioredoxin [SAR86 cluster bacterium]|tara:strand:+ start:79 stop:402 length:324 start_codon:yes stop_codon:yes gene_type:complete
MSKTIELTDSNFDQKISSSEVPVLVDYWAEWCGPCKMVGPILEELANDFEGKIVIGKVDVDTNKDSAAKQRVMSIPTLVLFKDGQPVDQRVGALTRNQLEEFINQYI